MKKKCFIPHASFLLLLLLGLTACGDDYEELGYVPTAIGDNSHTATQPKTEDDGNGQGGTGGESAGSLADILNSSYTGLLQVTVDGESNTPTEQTIEIEKVDDNHINFMLKNFMLASGEDRIPVGTINLAGIELKQDGNNVTFYILQDIYIQNGDESLSSEWLGPMLGPVPVELSGIGNKEQLDIDIDINMVSLGQIIHVDFQTTNNQ